MHILLELFLYDALLYAYELVQELRHELYIYCEGVEGDLLPRYHPV